MHLSRFGVSWKDHVVASARGAAWGGPEGTVRSLGCKHPERRALPRRRDPTGGPASKFFAASLFRGGRKPGSLGTAGPNPVAPPAQGAISLGRKPPSFRCGSGRTSRGSGPRPLVGRHRRSASRALYRRRPRITNLVGWMDCCRFCPPIWPSPGGRSWVTAPTPGTSPLAKT